MSTRSYPRLSVEEFAHQLLRSGDLDPVYIALREVPWPVDQVKRFLVAYWCCYHCGASAWLSEKTTGFWHWLMVAARNEQEVPDLGGRWPRAPERRHWRAKNAIDCVDFLAERYQVPEAMVNYVGRITYVQGLPKSPLPYAALASRVQEHVAFGPWIAFKVADMLERVLGVPVEFGYGDIMYEEPRKAALLIWREKAGVAADVTVKNESAAIRQVVDYLTERFKHYCAPPVMEADEGARPVGLQEVETILCKWKSHLNGHYPLNNDLIEIRHGVEPWAEVSEAAAQFLQAMPVADQPATVA